MFDAEEELRGNQDSFQSHFDSRLEAPILSANLVEVEQRLDVSLSDRPTIGAARQPGENLAGARRLVRAIGWAAHKNLAATGRLSQAFGVIRSADRDLRHGRSILFGPGRIASSLGRFIEKPIFRQWRVERTFTFPRVIQKVDPNQARTRLRREADFQMRIRRVPREIVSELLFRGSPGCRRIIPRLLAPNREQLDSCAIQANIELMRVGEANDLLIVFDARSLQADFDNVLAIDREVVLDRNPTTRAEREILAHALILHE